MPDITIDYCSSTIATLTSSGTKTLKTAGKYCSDDIKVIFDKPIAQAMSLNSSTGVITGTNAFSSSYYAASTKTSTLQLTSKAAATYYPSTADQTVSSYRWLTGAQTIKSVTLSNLTASNILSGVVVKVGDSANASRITQITGTASPGLSYNFEWGSISNLGLSMTRNGSVETPGWDFNFYPNDAFDVRLYVQDFQYGYLYYNDTLMSSVFDVGFARYSFSASPYDLYLSGYISGDSAYCYINTPTSYANENGTHDVYNYERIDIDVPDTYTITLTASGSNLPANSNYIKYKGTNYYPSTTSELKVAVGDSITVYVSGRNGQTIYIDGRIVSGTQSPTITPTADMSVHWDSDDYNLITYCDIFSAVIPTKIYSASTWTPGTTSKTLNSGAYLSGSQIISGDSNLVASNIASGISIFGVTGTYTSPNKYTCTLTGAGDSTGCYVKHNNQTKYYSSGSFEFNEGDTLYCYCVAAATSQTIYLNGNAVATGSYTYTLPGKNVGINMSYNNDPRSGQGSIVIAESVVPLTYKYSTTYTPRTYNQSLYSGWYLAENQTILGDSNLVASNIASGISIFGVTGTYESPKKYTCTLVGTGNSSYCYVKHNNQTKYYSSGSFEFSAGDTLYCYDRFYDSQMGYGGQVYVNDQIVSSSSTSSGASYTYTLPAKDITVEFDYTFPSGVYVTESVIPNVYRYSQSYTPRSTNITINSGAYLAGSQTILGDSNLVASNIASGISIFGVTGTYEGGVSSIYKSIYDRTTLSTMTNSVINDFLNTQNDIPSYAFAGWSFAYANNLTSLNVSTALRVREYAFYNCSSLITASFPEVTNIGVSAFYNCTKLSTISFPKATYIGQYAFANCSSFSTISFPSVTTIGTFAFYNCPSLTTASFPLATTIGQSAFYSCTSLTTISFPSVTSIGSFVFYACSKLTTANFPAATSIGASAFYNCTSLTTASFPEVSYIGDYAFYGCSKLSTISFPKAKNIGNDAFYRCTLLPAATNFPSVSTIGQYAFYNCTSLLSASFPEVTNIGVSAFYNCNKLTTANFPKAKIIGNFTFYSCAKLSTISFPSVTTIGDSAFYGCASLATASFPEATSISQYAFYNCIKLSTISFPKATSIGQYTFYNCSSLTTASFPEATSIGQYAFYSCTKLTTASFSKVTSIGQYAFASCIKLATISSPAVTYIGNSAFNYCVSLSTASFPIASYIGVSAFCDCRKLSIISFPEATSIAQGAFCNCSSLTTAIFPEATRIIGSAFYSCTKLATISFPKATSIGQYAFAMPSLYDPVGGNIFTYNLSNVYFPSVNVIDTYAFQMRNNLQTISFPVLTSVGGNAFGYCRSLTSAYFLGSSVPTAGANIFYATPMHYSTYTGSFGSIFVKASLANTFKSATNWVTYSSRIVGLTDAEITELNGGV